MEVRVQFFSQLKELAGASEKRLELAEGATVADLLAQLYRVDPELLKWERQILVGVGVEFVERSHVLQPNDQVALMPPGQGG